MQGLGVNWLASLVWEWRSRGGKIDAAEQARLFEAQLGDQNLARLFEQLELIVTTLAALKTQALRDAWAQYEAFVNEDGYADAALWTAAGRE